MLEPVVGGIGQPTDITAIPGHPDQLVALSKFGLVHQIDTIASEREDWFSVEVNDYRELGLLGVAFDPMFSETGRFWLHVTEARGEAFVSVIREYRTDPLELTVPESVGDALVVPQPTGVHVGGQLAFGPDGMLYASFGDGGPDNRTAAQDRSTLQGTIVRVDVSDPGPAKIPHGNPWSQRGVRSEIWAYGLRNPWRFTFGPNGTALGR